MNEKMNRSSTFRSASAPAPPDNVSSMSLKRALTVLIIGCGSIGARFAKLAAGAGLGLVLCDDNPVRLRNLEDDPALSDVSVIALQSIDPWPERQIDAAMICSPNHLHVEHALASVRRGIPTFVEKPLAHSMAGIETLIGEVRERSVTTMVGCNLRFTEGLQKVKSLLPGIGRVHNARIEFGYDLRKWRPSEDYRLNYAASRAKGGGVVLDAIHEIDYALWLFGRPMGFSGHVGRSGLLEIETEDYADFVLELERCPSLSVHLDYLAPDYTRGCVIHGQNGTIRWEFRSPEVRVAAQGREIVHTVNPDINLMYVRELDHFFAAVRDGARPMHDIEEASKTLLLALAMRDQMGLNRVEWEA
jgi:predicted dehydrogenase